MTVDKLNRGLIEAKKLRERLATRKELEEALDNTLAWADAMNKVMKELEPSVMMLSKSVADLKSENEALHQALKAAMALAEEDPDEAVRYLLRLRHHMGTNRIRQ